MITVAAEPFAYSFPPGKTALIVIDMQRDFVEPGGFGETLGNDVALLQAIVPTVAALLDLFRRKGWMVIHTREGHKPDLSDLHPAKRDRGNPSLRIGDPGPMGRILIHGEAGHDIIAENEPIPGELVIDKPGKGSFYNTPLEAPLKANGITHLVVAGVTTEVCVHTTLREANDRGYRCLVPADACASYFPEFHEVGLRMIAAQAGLFGCVTGSSEIRNAFENPASRLEGSTT